MRFYWNRCPGTKEQIFVLRRNRVAGKPYLSLTLRIPVDVWLIEKLLHFKRQGDRLRWNIPVIHTAREITNETRQVLTLEIASHLKDHTKTVCTLPCPPPPLISNIILRFTFGILSHSSSPLTREDDFLLCRGDTLDLILLKFQTNKQRIPIQPSILA